MRSAAGRICLALGGLFTLACIVMTLWVLVPALLGFTREPHGVVAGIDHDEMDPSCEPCDDFYRYATGKYTLLHPLTADRRPIDPSDAQRSRNDRIFDKIAADAVRVSQTRSDAFGTFGRLYAACRDTKTRDAASVDPLRPELRRIDAITDRATLLHEMARLATIGVSAGFVVSAAADPYDPDTTRVSVDASTLVLGDPSIYTDDTADDRRERTQYRAHIARMLAVSGIAPGEARRSADRVFDLERTTAAAGRRRDSLESPNYTAATLEDLQAVALGIDWRSYLSDVGVPPVEVVGLLHPRAVAAMARQVREGRLATWKAELRFRLIDTYGDALSAAVYSAQQLFYGRDLVGRSAPEPLSLRCARSTRMLMPDVTSAAFAAAVASPEDEARVRSIVASLRVELDGDLATSSWMGPRTRDVARQKLASMTVLVGGPKLPRRYDGPTYRTGPFALDAMEALRFNAERAFERVGKPRDRSAWSASAFVINEYYLPQNNQIVFPAANFGPLRFDRTFDDAAAYGTLGYLMGHEMTHGYDPTGRFYDGRGRLQDWWQTADDIRFRARAKCVADQYSTYSAGGQALSGLAVENEAIADLGGLTLAYRAFERTDEATTHRQTSDFTPEQRFFLAFAQRYAIDESPEHLRQSVLTGSHADRRSRVIGTVSDMPEFARAFHCPLGAAMFREHPCAVW